MKKGFCFFLFLTVLFMHQLQAQDTFKPVITCYNGHASIFPPSWLDRKTKARATAADTAVFHRDSAQLLESFGKYPGSLLRQDMVTIYIVGRLTFNRQYFTGTNATDAIYIAAEGNNEIEKTFHHEFSSILLRNHPSLSPETAWRLISPALRNSSSAAAVKEGLFSTGYDSLLCEKGYLSAYSLSNWENDFNIYAENIFAGGKAFWRIVDRYPAVQAKLKLVLRFYQSLWGGFTENYFRLLADEDGTYFNDKVKENISQLKPQ